MNRVQKKCLMASLFTHGGLLLAFIIGSAFVTPQPKPDIQPTIELVDIPDILIDENFAGGGGTPKAVPPTVQPESRPPVTPPVQPPPPQDSTPEPVQVPPKPASKTPEPKPEPVKPVKEPVREVKISKPKDPPTKKQEPKPSKPEVKVNLEGVIRTVESKAEAKPQAPERPSVNFQEVARNFGQQISANVSGQTAISVPGPGGAAYAPYSAYVKKVYHDAWVPPGKVDGDPIVRVQIVVARDGRVVSAKITSRSGNAALDRSVQSALDRVRKLRPFPEGATDPERTFNLNFNLASKIFG